MLLPTSRIATKVACSSQSQAKGPCIEYWKAPGDPCLMLSTKTAPSAIWTTSVVKPTTRLVRGPVKVEPVGRDPAGRGVDCGDGGNEEGGPGKVADESVAELWPVRGIEEGSGSLALTRRQEVAIERNDDEEEDVLGRGRGVADRDVQAFAQPELIPAQVVVEDAAERQEPDAESNHGWPEEEGDQ